MVCLWRRRFRDRDERLAHARAEIQITAKHLVAVECESALKAFAFENLWEPELVVFPHLVVGHFVDLHPHGHRFIGFGQLPLVEVANEDGAVNAQAVGKLEIEFTTVLEVRGC